MQHVICDGVVCDVCMVYFVMVCCVMVYFVMVCCVIVNYLLW